MGGSRDGGFIGLLVVDLLFPHGQSLKDKRAPLRSVRQRLRNGGYSVAEVGGHDTWQRSQLAITIVARSSGDVEKLLDDAHRTCEGTLADVVERQRVVLSLSDLE